MQVKVIFICVAFAWLFSCTQKAEQSATTADSAESKTQIAAMLDSFNIAAATAAYNQYFDYYTEDGTFNGTDATENWDKKAFMQWSKPFFDRKSTWNFTALKRNIYFGQHADLAWFEELLSTQMKICRGSGVVIKQAGRWKVQQYVLSTTVPNSVLDSVIKIKTPEEDSLMNTFSNSLPLN